MLFPNGDSIEPLDSVELEIAGLLPRIPATQWELGLDLVTNTGPFFHRASELPIEDVCGSSRGPKAERVHCFCAGPKRRHPAIRQFVAREGSGGFAAAIGGGAASGGSHANGSCGYPA